MNKKLDQCVFCQIIAGTSPAVVHYTDEEFVVFENNLYWYETQLLLVPKQHLSQSEMWSDENLVGKLCLYANHLGEKKCPNGYRIFSNFGDHGMQSQPHAHLQLIGGTALGLYVNGRPPLIPYKKTQI